MSSFELGNHASSHPRPTARSEEAALHCDSRGTHRYRRFPQCRQDDTLQRPDRLGGPDCNAATGTPGSGNLGAGDCYYYNPFTSGFRFSQAVGFEGVASPGGGNTALNNPDLLSSWLTDPIGEDIKTEMLVIDAMALAETDVALGGGNISFAAGLQFREDQYDREPNKFTNSAITPVRSTSTSGATHSPGTVPRGSQSRPAADRTSISATMWAAHALSKNFRPRSGSSRTARVSRSSPKWC